MAKVPACPYYGRTHKEQIVCLRDGAGTSGRGELHMDFPSQVCRLRYWMRYCCGDWEACSLAPELETEYEAHKDDKPDAVCYNKGSKPVKKRTSVRRNYNKWLTTSGLRKLEAFARKECSDEQIAKKCGCTVYTLLNWKQKYPEVREALERGRQTQ